MATPTKKAARVKRETKQSLKERFGGQPDDHRSQSGFTWNDVDGLTIRAAMAAIVSAGDAVLFGRTTDGGALSILVLSGDERQRFYGSTYVEIEDRLNLIRRAYGAPAVKVLKDLPPDKIG